MLAQGAVIWLTGLAGSGKSYIAEALCKALRKHRQNVIYLDGDELRELLGHFGYDKQARIEVSLRRSAFADFLSKQGMIVVVSAISMWNEIYAYNRKNLQNYFEVYVKCDFEELKRRDKKALYSKALSGQIQNVVGVDIEFDEPKPHLVLDNTELNELEAKVQSIISSFNKTFHLL
ncbi:adenylyl-sulfate kinase [Campylobacter sp. MIT 97-5078]|uniref:adenylyl-sulfate kinase n=1 Tax=Campylobacter sp. MIT 97-5078 TaxID=1548153 RepID=UPI000512D57C|nr:adenylyl-sulfate kinase [Campylobacter sp. MIT 97-5078]KGI55312.1 adenylylsulfate kinase [Campylobacter sp. MIT 97-5078]TQR27898.1 adenylyl-sulfate kinase [Campylobacter sp. MIT 97-5078]